MHLPPPPASTHLALLTAPAAPAWAAASQACLSDALPSPWPPHKQKIGEKMGDVDESLLGGPPTAASGAAPAPAAAVEINNILDAAK